jgi:hypothetical protein
MPTQHDDDKDFNGTCTFNGPVSFGADATGAATPHMLAIPFLLADIQAGALTSDDLPANSLIRSTALRITTPLTFSAGTTTGVTAKAGNADDDGFFAATQMSGAAGYRYPTAAGALIGVTVAGGTGGVVITFAATGGTPNLAEVSAGAGTLYIDYTSAT